MAKKKQTEALKQNLRKQTRRELTDADYLHTGSSLLNLACSGNVKRGIPKGSYVLFVGDTGSGKTWLGHTCFAEASIDTNFANYSLVYDNAENGALMDLEFYFGSELAQRLEPPAWDTQGVPLYSRTIEEFYYNVDDHLESGKPFIYLLDSIDALSSEPEEKKFDEHKDALRKDKTTKGDYGDGKAKVSARYMRKIISELERSRSILIVLNQTRDNIGAGLFEPSKTRSGGWALEFYAHFVLWASVGEHIKKDVKGKKRELGIKSKVCIRKNRLTGKVRIVEVPILHSFGVDNVGSMVDFLVDEKVWKKDKNGMIEATGIGPSSKQRRNELIKRIEDEELIDDTIELAQETWDEIEEACKVRRRSRYH